MRQCSQYSEQATGQRVLGFIPAGISDFSLFKTAHTGSGAHPTSYSMALGGGGSFQDSEVARA